MATARTGRRRAAGGRDGRLRGLTHRFARGGGVGGGSGVDGRIRLLRLVFIVFLVLVGGKAVALASSSANLTKIALEQQTATVALPAHRGAILSDLRGLAPERYLGEPEGRDTLAALAYASAVILTVIVLIASLVGRLLVWRYGRHVVR